MKNFNLKLIVFILALTRSALGVYGIDDRIDFHELSSEGEKELARAVAFRLDKHELRGWTFQRYWKIVTASFSEQNVCEGERFFSQPSIRKGCSAVLVSPKHILTAGNCIREHYCRNDLFYWMFNHHLEGPDDLIEKRHKKYFSKCERVVKQVFDPSSGYSFALLELEQEVRHVRPVKISLKKRIPNDEELIVMGHPRGLPLKIADNIFVKDQNEEFFLSNSDISGATGGAPIFSKRSGELEGVLIYGNPNYINETGCLTAFRENDAYGAELAIKAGFISEILIPELESF